MYRNLEIKNVKNIANKYINFGTYVESTLIAHLIASRSLMQEGSISFFIQWHLEPFSIHPSTSSPGTRLF